MDGFHSRDRRSYWSAGTIRNAWIKKSQSPIGFIWDIIKAAISLFWDTNIAAVRSMKSMYSEGVWENWGDDDVMTYVLIFETKPSITDVMKYIDVPFPPPQLFQAITDPFNKYRIHHFHPMTSNYFQFAFWILFNYVCSLNKPETINEIEKNLTSLGGNYVFCTRVSQTLISGPNSYPGSFLRSLQEPGYEVAPGPCRTGGSQALWTRLGSVHKVNFILHFFSLQRLLCWRRAFNSGKEAQVHV